MVALRSFGIFFIFFFLKYFVVYYYANIYYLQQAIGVILGLSEAILGLTIFAMVGVTYIEHLFLG